MKQSGVHLRHSTAELAKIKSIKFTLLSKEEIDRWAVVELTNPKLYSNRTSTAGGLNDPRMGVCSTDQSCLTCGETKECQGHFGVIKLPEPIYHYGFMKFVEKVLKCICYNCARLRKPMKDGALVPPIINIQDPRFLRIIKELSGRKRLVELSKLLVNVTECHVEKEGGDTSGRKGCGTTSLYNKIQIKEHRILVSCRMNKRMEANKGNGLDGPEFNDKNTEEKEITAQTVYRLFQKIDPRDAAMMGFTESKPMDLLIYSLLVCPPQLRPVVEMNPEKKAEDSITVFYNYILACSNEVKKNKKDNKELMYNEQRGRIRALEIQVASIMQKVDAKKSTGTRLKVKQNSKEVKSFSERLKGKEGRFRQHLMGKRVDFSARSVISPDSNLALDELGVPQKVAAAMTFPEQITELNINRIRKLYEEGKILHLLKPTQDRKRYEPVQLKDPESFNRQLTYGVIVERCLQDGDFVLFNRQPTLHRMSMMGHRVRILPYNTFRLNLSVCAPYNADFDGDEMNMHVPQNYETLAEIKHIAHVPRQIVTPKNNQPVMGMVQDALLGIFLFTLRETFLTREEAMNLVIWIDSIEGKQDFEQLQLGQLPMPAIIKPVPLWTGKQIMSMIIPSKISMIQRKDKDDFWRNVKDSGMIIRRGELIMGALQKEIVGSGAGGLIHNIWLDIGPDATNYFLTTAQRIVNNWLTMNSFSVGAADVVPTLNLRTRIADERAKTEKVYWDLLNVLRSKEKIDASESILHHKEKTIMESFEVHLNQKLNDILGICNKVVVEQISPYKNNIYKMIWAKSKGSETNLTQIVGMLANQNVEGRRIPEGFSKRTLPHFCKHDKSPEPRGFVFSSYYTGLGPHEFFFHSMGGREGLSDTAVKTARTGYIQRKLIKALEDVIVKYDGTVRDSQNNLIQLMYGEDGFAAEFIEKQLVTLDESEPKFDAEYHWNWEELTNTYNIGEEGVMQLEQEFSVLGRAWRSLRDQFMLSEGNKDIYCPIKVDRLINNIKQKDGKSKPSQDLSPLYVYQEVEKLLDICVHPQFQNDYKKLFASEKTDQLERNERDLKLRKITFEKETGVELFRNVIRLHLSSKKICKMHCLTRNGFVAVVELIKAKFTQALINPGEAIGAIAAQCVGEPTTQMTLNTFHSAGIKASNVTLGVPRLQELVEVSKNMKTTSLKIYLDKSEKDYRRYVKELPEMYLGDFIVGCKIFYDNGSRFTCIENKNSTDEISPQDETSQKVTPWLMMLTLDSGVHLSSDIKDKIKESLISLTQRFSKMTRRHSLEDDKIQVYLRCLENFPRDPAEERYGKGQDFNYYKFLKDKEAKIRGFRIEGIDNIKKVYTAEYKAFKRKPNGEIEKNEKGENVFEELKMLVSEGTNLMKVLSMPKVDSSRTTSNSITEVLEVLGIEAARQSFLNEFREVLKPYGIYINYRHLATLADWMTRRGRLTPINRNGINRISDVSVLRKASFEETVEVLYDAAIFSEVDYLRGVSEKIIVGEAVQIGTGNFDILIDKNKVKDFKIANAMDKKEDIEMEARNRNGLESVHDMIGTPQAFMTPGPFAAGASYRQMQSPKPVGQSPTFTPNPYAGRFTPDIHHDFTSTAITRSPALGFGTPLLPFPTAGNTVAEYSPTSSPVYPNPSPGLMGSSRPFPVHSPYHMGYVTQNPHSPRYPMPGSSPSYSPHNRSAYQSSRISQSPRYSPMSSNHSPSYSGTPVDRNPKNEEKSDDEEYDE